MVFLIDYIAPSVDHPFIYHINIYVLYACKVVAVIATAVAVIVLVDLGYVYNAKLHAIYAIKDVLPKALHFVVSCVIYGCNVATVLLHRIILYVKYAWKFTIALLHRLITYVTDSCKWVIANVPLQYAVFSFSVTIVAMLLLCLIDSITLPSEGFVYLTLNYMKYVWKVFIINAILCAFLLALNLSIKNGIIDREFFKDCSFCTLYCSFLYLFAHCISFVLTILFQFLLSNHYNPDNLKSGMVFYVVYSLETMIDYAVYLLTPALIMLGADEKERFHHNELILYAFAYCLHIVTYIFVSFEFGL